jgi:hypothetical protein
MTLKEKYKREYSCWTSMKVRCNDKSNQNYGGRGITFCKEWRVFANFIKDMGPRPEGYSLDRIDANGNYEPGNCRWADNKTQSVNRRCCKGYDKNYRTDYEQKRDEAKGAFFQKLCLARLIDRKYSFYFHDCVCYHFNIEWLTLVPDHMIIEVANYIMHEEIHEVKQSLLKSRFPNRAYFDWPGFYPVEECEPEFNIIEKKGFKRIKWNNSNSVSSIKLKPKKKAF